MVLAEVLGLPIALDDRQVVAVETVAGEVCGVEEVLEKVVEEVVEVVVRQEDEVEGSLGLLMMKMPLLPQKVDYTKPV